MTGPKLGASAVTAAKIATGAVTGSKMAAGSVGSTAVADGAITSAGIADGAVLAGDIADGTLGSSDVADGAITSGDVADNTLLSGDIADGTITGADVGNGALSLDDIGGASLSFYAVESDGSIYKTRGVAASSVRNAEGEFVISFGRNITECMFFVTTGYTDGIVGVPDHNARRYATAWPHSEFGVTVWTLRVPNEPDSPVLQDNDFMLMVAC